jgi:putative oxygen-independent coproporphyrinogen III oxidase
VTSAAPEGAVGEAPREATHLRVERPPAGLYLHVPFCVSHCPYCDFVVVAGREARGPGNRIAAFAAALEQELALRADLLDERWGRPSGPERQPLDTVYLGGGTPSLLPAVAVARLLDVVRERFGLSPDAEVTLEANPGPDERGDLAAARAAGVTRLSIGAQRMDAVQLRALGRRHSPNDVAATALAARDAGIESVSLDLLYDVPGDSIASWQRTLDEALALEPDHLSLYALTLDDPDAEGITGAEGDHLPVSGGARRWRERARRGQDDDRAAEMYRLADARLAAAGFSWYEISNWARPGHASRHNLGYWSGLAWEAAGPGAHAFDGRTRRWNAARLDRYLAALSPVDGPPRLPPGSRETFAGDDPRARAVEGAILALRTRAGLASSAGGRDGMGDALAWGVSQGLLEPNGPDRLVLTLSGRLLSNELFVRLL